MGSEKSIYLTCKPPYPSAFLDEWGRLALGLGPQILGFDLFHTQHKIWKMHLLNAVFLYWQISLLIIA